MRKYLLLLSLLLLSACGGRRTPVSLAVIGITCSRSSSGATQLVKAWLLNVPEGVFSVVLSCPLDRLDADLGTLEAMLETLTLTM